MYNTELSTGCKAALVVLNRKDNIINLTEAGVNVRDFLLKYCKDGAVYIPHLDATVSSYVNDVNKEKEIFDLQIEVCLDGKVFEDIESINAYIMNPFMYA